METQPDDFTSSLRSDRSPRRLLLSACFCGNATRRSHERDDPRPLTLLRGLILQQKQTAARGLPRHPTPDSQRSLQNTCNEDIPFRGQEWTWSTPLQ